DRLAIDVTFNHLAQDRGARRSRLAASAPQPTSPPDSFSALAEFVTAYPRISAALDTKLLPIDPSASDNAVDQAAVALGSFVALVEYVAEGMTNAFDSTPPGRLNLSADDGYAFELFEGDDPSVDVSVLVIAHSPPLGIGPRGVLLPGFDTVACTGAE